MLGLETVAEDFDIAIVGGGLSGSLIALALRRFRPDLAVAIVEAGPTIGGNHVWSFFESDIAPAHRPLIEPLVVARWDDGYDVRFPAYTRHLTTPYRSVTSERLARAVADALPADNIATDAVVTDMAPDGICIADGRRIASRAVIDARGLERDPAPLRLLEGGWQKFAGQMLRLSRPHGLTRPVVMDATVAQHDGFRFVYSLPFSDTEIFVEDTYYSDGPDLDRDALSARIGDYAESQGWVIDSVISREWGVIPVVTGGSFPTFAASGGCGVAKAGVRAGLFQPLTSYSLPDAVRFAVHLATVPQPDARSLVQASQAFAATHWRQTRFYRQLARMLFGAARPDRRYRVLQRFYGLDEILVERFYAGQGTLRDKVRILSGRPPVPLHRAAMVLAGLGRPGSLEITQT